MTQITNVEHRRSKDGKWFITTTTITEIMSIAYYEKMLNVTKQPEQKAA